LKSSDQHNVQAIVWVLAGTGIFSLIFASGKLLEVTDWVWQIIFLRYLSGLGLMLLIAKIGSVKLQFSPIWPQHLLRALMGGSGGCCAIYAAANMAVADAAAIGLLDSVLAIVLGMLVFHEVVRGKRWVAIAGCVIGAIIVLLEQGAFQGSQALGLPAIVALLSALFLAIESVLIRSLATRESAIVVLLHVNFFGAILFFIPAALVWGQTDLITKLLLCLLGPLAILGQYCNIRGYRIADLSIVAPVGYSWILFAIAIDYFLFEQRLSVMVLIGAAVILVSGYFLAVTRNE
jgi:drug/metabolite transporter (DMT)-like permease